MDFNSQKLEGRVQLSDGVHCSVRKEDHVSIYFHRICKHKRHLNQRSNGTDTDCNDSDGRKCGEGKDKFKKCDQIAFYR
ncbi:hypothetical protein AOXY_G20650 [Acipenser oxyrinchus oxyrinchus]|uniref:Uncharacterized protein n=1 Tax=Acipenser oxyrinchus oxyrinchus TaxID=40147 RepID=A0AAD8D138_ACIOX|nr:hypothetical protein AOXY_G20650 [Acipenser oxyrinchus oxyrinchus]